MLSDPDISYHDMSPTPATVSLSMPNGFSSTSGDQELGGGGCGGDVRCHRCDGCLSGGGGIVRASKSQILLSRRKRPRETTCRWRAVDGCWAASEAGAAEAADVTGCRDGRGSGCSAADAGCSAADTGCSTTGAGSSLPGRFVTSASCTVTSASVRDDVDGGPGWSGMGEKGGLNLVPLARASSVELWLSSALPS